MTSPAVLIVGAGPSGLILALALVKNGVPVRIIEREVSHRRGQRGAGIQPRSLELFRALGVLPPIEDRALTVLARRLYELPGGTKVLKTWDIASRLEPTPGFPYLNAVMYGQNSLEAVLRDELAKYDCEVELGTELRSFEQDDDKVVAHIVKTTAEGQVEETREYQFLVGADGARGVVRKGLGLSFLGETHEEQRLLVGDIHVQGLDTTYWHTWGSPASQFFSLRPTDQGGDLFSFNFVAQDLGHAKIVADRDYFIKCIYEVTGRTDLKFGELIWISEFRTNIRMVEKFGEGRVFIAGDAAHVHSPTGGQGLNTSIQDSYNLGWKLALVQRGLAPRTLLDSYTAERIPIIAAMLQRTTSILNETLAARSREEDARAWQRGGRLLQLAVHCRGSPIVIEDADAATTEVEELRALYKQDIAIDVRLHAGDRASDAPGVVKAGAQDATRLFDVFGPAVHTALVFAGGDLDAVSTVLATLRQYPQGTVQSAVLLPQGFPGDGAQAIAGADFALEDREGHAYGGYGVSADRLTVVVVRPDGVIGAIVGGPAGVKQYFDGIFGA